MKKLLIFTDWFLPGYKAGGPIRSLSSLVALLQNEYDIYIITSDRDLNDSIPYLNIKTNTWIYNKIYHTYYSGIEQNKFKLFKRLIHDLRPEFIYLNSMFSFNYSILPLVLHKFYFMESKIIMAPRGMLKASALAHKRIKKLTFIRLQSIFNLFRNVKFHATDEQEVEDIKRYFANNSQIYQIQNVGSIHQTFNMKKKVKGKCTLVFTSRIHPIKGLKFILNSLLEIKGQVEFFVIGPIEDTKYYNECKSVIKLLPKNIDVTWLGPKPFDEIKQFYEQCHFFVLPTQGENFGHAIFEALSSGLPVLISDQTPWKDLSISQAGWDLPLLESTQFVKVLHLMVQMEDIEYQSWVTGAKKYSLKNYKPEELKLKYQNLLN